MKKQILTLLRVICRVTGSREQDDRCNNDGRRITGTENQKRTGTAILIRCITREDPCPCPQEIPP